MRIHDCESLLEGKDYDMVSREYVKMADACRCGCVMALEERWEHEEDVFPVFLTTCRKCGRMKERNIEDAKACVWVECPVCNGHGGIQVDFDEDGYLGDETENCPLCDGYTYVPLTTQEYDEACQLERQQALLVQRYGTAQPASIHDFYATPTADAATGAGR